MVPRSLAHGTEQGAALNEPSWLLVRFGAMGDCLMACWAATAIRRRYPQGRLVWAVESRCSDVIPASLAKVEAFSRPRRRGFLSPAAWVRQYRCYARLRAYRIDVGIDLHGHLKTAFCLRLSGARRRVALRATDALAARLNPVVRLDPMPAHEVDRYLALLATLGQFESPIRPDGFEPEPNGDGGPLATVMAGASRPDKRMSNAQLLELAEMLSGSGFEVEFLGGEFDVAPDVCHANNLVGKLGVRQVMSRIARSSVHIAPDTWTGHAAAAYGTPVVSVFGQSHNTPERYRPYTAKGRVHLAPTVQEMSMPEVLASVRELASS